MEIKINYDNNKVTIECSDAGFLNALLDKYNKLVTAFDEFEDKVNVALIESGTSTLTREELCEKEFEPLPF